MRCHFQTLSLFPLLAALCLTASACASGAATPAVVTGAAGAGSTSAVAATAAADGIIDCATFVSALQAGGDSPFLTVMQDYSDTFYNSSTGDAIRFLAVQPTSASSGRALVFFNGTSQITPDWPIKMLIDEKTSTSLCDGNALVFSDYPGIAGTTQPEEDDFTFDNIADNVYHLLVDLDGTDEFDIAAVSPIGWSLGSEASMKFTTLALQNSAFKSSGMSIDKLFLIATKPGGDLYSAATTNPESCAGETRKTAETFYTVTGSQAMCVTSVLNELLSLDTAVEWAEAVSLKESLVAVMFPYVFTSDGSSQALYGPGDPSDICAATLDGDKVSALCDLETDQSVETACAASDTSSCAETVALYQANREQSPYLDQIGYQQFLGQRRLNFTYDYGNCETVSTSSWTSAGCSFNQNQTGSELYDEALIVNGSPCTSTLLSSPDGSPNVYCIGLADAPDFNGVYIFNGQEDMFVRYDYGQALCNWFNQYGPAPCTLNTYESTGHAVMYDYASDIFAVIYNALSTSE